MAIMSVSWYVVVAVRFTVTRWQPTGWAGGNFRLRADRLHRCAGVALPCRRSRALAGARRSAAVLVIVLMLMFNGLANGWPPYWERLPGPTRSPDRNGRWSPR